MQTPSANPICSIDIYMLEGGRYTLNEAQVLECTVQKDLRDSGGSASIILAPGGPNGQNFPSWSQIVTLQSLVVIAMQRGDQSNVVFVGIVRSVEEDQQWQSETGVTRNTRIEAMDWGAWCQDFNWSSLAFLAVANGAVEAALTGAPPEAGAPNTLFGGQQNSNPAQIGYNWFTGFMGGTKGVLANTQIKYQNHSLLWPQATTGFFETYPYGAIFPGSNWYLSQDGTWYQKFSEIFEAPYYELIVGTAPLGSWNPALLSNTTSTQVSLKNGGTAEAAFGTSFSSLGLPNATPALAQITARICPVPVLEATATPFASAIDLSNQPAYQYSGVDVSRWNALPNYTLDATDGFIESLVSLGIHDYYNFFILNPTANKQALGLSSAPGIFMYAYSGAINVAGIRRYGMKSQIRDTLWIADPSFEIAGSSTPNLATLVADLTNRLASFYTPLSIMESATVTTSLLPSVFVGSRFTYSPFRGDEPWQFYVNAVQHQWKYGGPSTTTVGLERGLPLSVYSDTSTLMYVVMGQAQRQNGSIIAGLPAGSGPPLQTIGLAPDSLKTILSQIALVYGSPGVQ